MSKIKVGIIEDEMIIALGIAEALGELGYDVTDPAINYTEAIEMISREKPDILLLDIQLGGNKDGIDVAERVNRDFNIPFIFLTANADVATVARAKNVAPHAYLVKPFRKNELYTSIELCLHNFSRSRKDTKATEVSEDVNYVIKDSIFIKQGHCFQKVKVDDILYLESDNNYVHVHTLKNKMLVRNSIQDYLDLLGAKHFYRVHRSYAVNINHVQTINTEYLIINQAQIPIAKTYRDHLLAILKLG
jgi:DNA-binding LytR/AlgR family response regulator